MIASHAAVVGTPVVVLVADRVRAPAAVLAVEAAVEEAVVCSPWPPVGAPINPPWPQVGCLVPGQS